MSLIDFYVIDNVIHRRSGFSPVQGEKDYTKLRFIFEPGYGWDNCIAVTASFAISADQAVYSSPAIIDKSMNSAVFDIPSTFREYEGRVFVSVQGSYSENGHAVTIASNIAEVDIQRGILIKEGTEQRLYERIAALVQCCSVVQYGAKGDGETDDTQAIYKAIVNNDVVYFPPGVYRTAGIIITNPGAEADTETQTRGEPAGEHPKTLLGAGRSTVIRALGISNYGYFCSRCGHVHRGDYPGEDYLCPDCLRGREFLVNISDGKDAVFQIGRKTKSNKFDFVNECTVSDLSIEGDYGESTSERVSRGLCLYATKRSTIHNVWIRNTKGFGVDLASNAEDCQLSDIKVKYCTMHGISQGGFGNSLTNIEVSQCSKDGINIAVGGCQFANVKVWGNYEAGIRISGAKYCMISNVNSQQNRGCGVVIENNAAYNVLTGVETVGNNYSGNYSDGKYNKWTPNLTFEGGSGFVVGGHDNTVQGSDVRTKWTNGWFGIEKSALHIPYDSQNNRIELLCTDGDKTLSAIYNDSTTIGDTGKNHFGNLGFEKSVLLSKFNSNNHVRINGSQIDLAAIGTTWTALEYSSYVISTLDGLNGKAEVEKSGNTFTVTGNSGNANAINEITPRALKNSGASSGSDNITGAIRIANTYYGYPLRVYYAIPINQLETDKILGIKITAKIAGDDTWVAVPVLFLRNTSNNDKVIYLDNTFNTTEARSIVKSDGYITRVFAYTLSEQKISEEAWTDCQLILALLKTGNKKKIDENGNSVDDNDSNHSVTLDISELKYAVSDVTTITGREFDETHYTKAEVDETHYTKAEVDAAHYTKTEIAALLGLTVNCTPLDFISGKYIAFDASNFTETINSSYRYNKIDVSPGEEFKINVLGGANARAFAFYDSSGSVISGASASNSDEDAGGVCFDGYFEASGNNYSYNGIITAPDGAAYLVINDKKSAAELCYKLPSQAALGGGNT